MTSPLSTEDRARLRGLAARAFPRDGETMVILDIYGREEIVITPDAARDLARQLTAAAGDLLDAQDRRIQQLREALEPLAARSCHFDKLQTRGGIFARIPYSDLARARAAMHQEDGASG